MINALRGTKDILPGEIEIWQNIESISRDIFHIYGYKEIRTPIIEEASLFIRSIGDTTDIVQKEMYVFTDRGGRNIALRPEATASIARAYIENSIARNSDITKLFYIGPMFRSERPQQGRQRQFYQLGIEAIGSDSPWIDAEVICTAVRLLEKLQIKNFSVKLNSLGCHKDKQEIINKYRELLKPCLNTLCKECNARYEKNVLRILDCKEEQCREIIAKVQIKGALCDDCAKHFEAVKEALNILGIKFEIDSKIVRGLDYYTKTVFEITQGDLGAKDAICAGGRYNNLIKDIGGHDTPAVGFAFGIERLVLVLQGAVNIRPQVSCPKVFIAVAGNVLYGEAFKLLGSLRNAGISSEIDYNTKSLKAQMRKAEKLGARFVIIVGEEEFKQHKVMLRDMDKKEQKEINLDDVIPLTSI